jgi:hypothetical protein
VTLGRRLEGRVRTLTAGPSRWSSAGFAGGFALEAAEQVSAGDGIESEAVLDLLSQLVSKSLVLSELRPHQPARYRLREPVR